MSGTLLAFLLETQDDSIQAYTSKHAVNTLFDATGLNAKEKGSSFRGRFKCLLLGAAGTSFILIGPILAIALGIFKMCEKPCTWGHAIVTFTPDILIAMPISTITGLCLVALGMVGAVVDPSIPFNVKTLLLP